MIWCGCCSGCRLPEPGDLIVEFTRQPVSRFTKVTHPARRPTLKEVLNSMPSMHKRLMTRDLR